MIFQNKYNLAIIYIIIYIYNNIYNIYNNILPSASKEDTKYPMAAE